MTQCERVLQYMNEYGGISTRDAFTELGIVSLSRRICDLKKKGHIITGEYQTIHNRYGEKVQYKRYTLERSGAHE